ncbi:hypothetical protein FOZ62_012952, partial [Perkinsus olseni]
SCPFTMLPVSRRLLPTTGALFRAAAATPRFHFSSTPSFVANRTLARGRAFATTSTTEGSDPVQTSPARPSTLEENASRFVISYLLRISLPSRRLSRRKTSRTRSTNSSMTIVLCFS